MLESVKTQIDYLEIMASNFISTDKKKNYSKEKIVQLNKSEKLILQFNFINVAISRNGGLIALCKQESYFDEKKSRINDSIIIMHQDASTRYFIPINWDYNSRHVVSLEFNEKEQLFAFCNDGTIYKLDILTQKPIEITNSYKIKPEGIHKAKLFEKGYIILTEQGTIYLIEDLKNPDPQFIISVKEQLGFSNDIDFIGIPAKKSCSKKFEILITNQKGEGVLHIEKQEPRDPNNISADNRRSFQYQKKDMSNKGKVVNVSLLNSSNLENYNPKAPRLSAQTSEFVMIDDQLKGNFEDQTSNSSINDKIGNVTAMTISTSNDYIALYVSETNTVFYFSSQISNKVSNKIDKLKFTLDSSLDNNEYKIQQQILSFKTEHQLLFCGENNVAICGGQYIMMINKDSETIPILVDETEHKELTGYLYCKCVAETDGIRFMTNEDIYLLTPVPNELNQICDPFSNTLSQELIKSYGNYISKNPSCNDQLRKIGDKLPETIEEVAKAAASIYWNGQDPDTFNKRDIQNFIIKAAQFGKSIVQKEVFNFDRFNDICKSIRVINYMRNYPLKPRYLTYYEYLDMNPDIPSEIVNKTMRQLNFKLAFDVCKFLGEDDKNVFLRYAIAKIKKLPVISDPKKENSAYNELMDTFKNVENISYIEIAKKCIKYHKYDLAEKFLQNEKSILVKIPQYLQLGKWEKALELSLKSCDLSVIKVAIDKIYKVEQPSTFNDIMAKFPQAHSAVINYYKSIGRPDELNRYLNRQKDQEELLFISLENFFKSQNIEERERHLKEAKKCLNSAKNIDYSFYKSYLSDLENSIKFKNSCLETQKIIETNDITSFDNSVYDCFLKAKIEQYPWIETQNKKYFEISKRKMTVLRFRTLAKEGKINEIEEIIQKEGYKKLDISPLKIAYILHEFKLDNNKVAEYAIKEPNPELYDEKFNFLMKMEKYMEAVEAALSDRKNERMMEFINIVLKNRPDLKPNIENLCDKYKVRI